MTTCSSAQTPEVDGENAEGKDGGVGSEGNKYGVLMRIKNAATCSAATGVVTGEHAEQEGAQHDAANRDGIKFSKVPFMVMLHSKCIRALTFENGCLGLTLSQKLSCYGMRNKLSSKGSEGSTLEGRDGEAVIHGAVQTVMDKLKTENAASVVAINGQDLSAHDLRLLMQALAESWQRDSKPQGSHSQTSVP